MLTAASPIMMGAIFWNYISKVVSEYVVSALL